MDHQTRVGAREKDTPRMERIEDRDEGLIESCQELARRLSTLATQERAGVMNAVELLVSYAEEELAGDVLTAEADALVLSRQVVRRLFEQKLQARLDRLDDASSGQPTPCLACTKNMASQGRRTRGWLSSMGPLRLRRRYVHCSTCNVGRAPSQQTIGLGDSEFTPRLEETCTLMSTTVPFGMARSLVEQVCGIEVSTKGVQQCSDRRGAALLERLSAEAHGQRPYDDAGLPREDVPRPESTVEEAAKPRRAYIEIDGVIPMTRVEKDSSTLTEIERARQARAKADKARGGKGKLYEIVGREVKNAVLYSGDHCAQTSIGRGCLIDKRYVSCLGGWEDFALQLWAEIRRQRFDQAHELVIISDGAEWIRSIAKWLPVKPKLILDLFHVKHRIWEVAHALFGNRSDASKWARGLCTRVEEGRALGVIRTLNKTTTRSTEAAESVRLLIHYLESNLDRMDYPAYRAAGLRVGSGAVESANFHVTGARLKLQGMRWSEPGAAQMAALRADLHNGRHQSRSRELLAA